MSPKRIMPARTDLIIIRHTRDIPGDADDKFNEGDQNAFKGGIVQFERDTLGLTDEGKQQARAIRRWLLPRGLLACDVYAHSTAKRAEHTARTISPKLSWVPCEDFIERKKGVLGALPRHIRRIPPYGEIYEWHKNNPTAAYTGIESVRAVQERFLKKACALTESQKNRLMVVSHADVINSMLLYYGFITSDEYVAIYNEHDHPKRLQYGQVAWLHKEPEDQSYTQLTLWNPVSDMLDSGGSKSELRGRKIWDAAGGAAIHTKTVA